MFRRAQLSAALAALCACAPAPPPPAPAPGPHRAAPSRPPGSRWVDRTLASLSLREKAGQLLMPGALGDFVPRDSREMQRLLHWVEDDGIGGISLSIGMPHSYAAKLNALQRHARIPLLVSANLEKGPGERLAGIYALPYLMDQGGGTDFPPPMAVGATGSDSLAFAVGRATAEEARAVGVHLTFSPVLDVNSNPANPIINIRSFGEDPAEVGRLGVAFLRGVQAGGLLATGKHFPGHGDTGTDSHIDLPIVTGDRARLDRVELPPFRAAVDAGVDAIMTAHIAAVGMEGPQAPPATLSRYLLTGILRGEMGFDGLIITDAMEMGAITRHYGDVEALLRAIEAGADVLLKPLDVDRALDGIVAAVESGRIPESRLDASVRRILAAKARLRLQDGAGVDLAAVDSLVGTRAHRALADSIATRSITLVRDDDGTVPLSAGRVLSVSYTGTADPVSGRVFDAGLAAAGLTVESAPVDGRTSPAEWERLLDRARGADLVIASAYVTPREHAGSVAAGADIVRFVDALCREGRPVVLISFGSPYLLPSFPCARTQLLAWGRAPVMQRAAARALAGRAAISGRLPVSLPPRYPRGAGLRRGAGPR